MNTPDPVPSSQSQMPAPVTTGAIVWYKDPIYRAVLFAIVGGVATLYPKVAIRFHMVTPIQVEAWLDIIGGAVTLLGLVVIWFMKQFSKLHPIALTPASALANPATQALLKTQEAMKEAGVPLAVDTLNQLKDQSK